MGNHNDSKVATPVQPFDVQLVEIVVSVGEQTFSPVQYHSFKTGALSVRATLSPGATMEQVAAAHERLLHELQAMTEQQFRSELALFLERVRFAANETARVKGGR